MSLVTGKSIHQYQWKILPISLDVLERVNQIALTEGQPLVVTNFKYEWRPGKIVIGEDDKLEDEEILDQIDNETRIAAGQGAPPRIYEIDNNASNIQREDEVTQEEHEEEIDELFLIFKEQCLTMTQQ